MSDMVIPTFGAFTWDFILGITFVLGVSIALPLKKVSIWKRVVLSLVCGLILCVTDIVQKQDSDELVRYIIWFTGVGVLEFAAIVIATIYSEGSLYKRTVVNAFTIIFASALVFAGTSVSEPAREVMAAETTARDSAGIGYIIVDVVQLLACIVAALLVRLLLKWIKGDGIIYKILFAVIVLYDLIGVPARGYINFKVRHVAPAANEVLIILGITYLLMTLTLVAVVAVSANLSKGAEIHDKNRSIRKKSLIEKRILEELDTEDGDPADNIDEVLKSISAELERRGTVLELLNDMTSVKSRLGSKCIKLKKELAAVSEELKTTQGGGGYMTLCVRPLGDTMMLMCEVAFAKGQGKAGSRVITRVL